MGQFYAYRAMVGKRFGGNDFHVEKSKILVLSLFLS